MKFVKKLSHTKITKPAKGKASIEPQVNVRIVRRTENDGGHREYESIFLNISIPWFREHKRRLTLPGAFFPSGCLLGLLPPRPLIRFEDLLP